MYPYDTEHIATNQSGENPDPEPPTPEDPGGDEPGETGTENDNLQNRPDDTGRGAERSQKDSGRCYSG